MAVKGVVLRAVNVGESDKMLTILTPDMGKMSVYANGARNLKSKNFASSRLYSYSEFTFKETHGKTYIGESSPIESFFGIGTTLEGSALASYIAEVACDVAVEDQPEEELTQLVLNCLYCISNEKKPLWQIKAVFELRCASILGFMPDMVGCRNCGQSGFDSVWFDIDNGCYFCEECFKKIRIEHESENGRIDELSGIYGKFSVVVPMSGSVFEAIRFVIYSKPERIMSFSLKDEAIGDFCSTSEKYLLSHLERNFTSLDFYHSVIQT